jgi:hypothetical protein
MDAYWEVCFLRLTDRPRRGIVTVKTDPLRPLAIQICCDAQHSSLPRDMKLMRAGLVTEKVERMMAGGKAVDVR